MTRTVSVSDITMRQPSGAGLFFREKIELSKMLDRLGVSTIETEAIRNGRSDSLLIKSLASAVTGATVAVPIDIAVPDSPATTWSALCGAAHPRLQVSVPVSTVQMEYFCHLKPSAITELVTRKVAECVALCPEVEFIAGDFTRAEKSLLESVIKAACDAGASVVTVSDASGDLLPDEFRREVAAVKALLPENVKLGVNCCNEKYMAAISAVASVQAGADEVKTSVCSKSTASLKQFATILGTRSESLGVSCNIALTELSRVVDQIRSLISSAKGRSASAVPGLQETTDEVQLTANVDIATVRSVAASMGYDLGDDDAERVYDMVIQAAMNSGAVGAKELDAIVASIAFQVPPTYILESYVVNSGNTITATCHLRLLRGEELLESVCVGDGPVDAAFEAIDKIIGRHYELDDFQLRSVTEGREAMGEAVVRLRNDGKIYSGRGISTDIVGSSVMAYLNAVNKIAYEEGEA